MILGFFVRRAGWLFNGFIRFWADLLRTASTRLFLCLVVIEDVIMVVLVCSNLHRRFHGDAGWVGGCCVISPSLAGGGRDRANAQGFHRLVSQR